MPALVQKGVGRTLFEMALPMLAGTFALNAYNLTDTWFVSRLGTVPLAAMGFTFPVAMLVMCLIRGIGSGVTTLASTALGRHDHEEAARLLTHGITLAYAVCFVMATAGFILADPIFRALGAKDTTLVLVAQYMRIWFVGMAFTVPTMFGNGMLIAAGDARTASRIMVSGTILNVFLDWIMIFGKFGFPAMGIAGAALATVISQAVPTVWLFWRLGKVHRLLDWREVSLRRMAPTIRPILRFAIPSILGMILMPISGGVITKLVSTFGDPAVAACAAAGRIEMFAFMVPMSLGMSLTPFVSQNFGAGRLDRLREAEKLTTKFAIGYGALTTVAFFLFARPLAAIFTDDPKVVPVLISYIRIISFGYGMMEVHRYCSFFLTGTHRPISATLLGAIRILLLLIPLSCLGAWAWGITGLFVGRLITDVTGGAIGLVWVHRILHARKDDDGPIVEAQAS